MIEKINFLLRFFYTNTKLFYIRIGKNNISIFKIENNADNSSFKINNNSSSYYLRIYIKKDSNKISIENQVNQINKILS